MEKANVERSLDASIKDGASYAVMAGLGDPGYVGACALLLGVSPAAVAILVSVPVFLGALAQLLPPLLIDFGVKRKPIMVGGALVQAVAWLPMLAAPFAPRGIDYALLFGGFVLHFAALHATVAPWTSIMGDLVPAGIRGRYFGYRAAVALLLQFSALIVSGAGLEFFRRGGPEHERWGFAVVFAGAFLARLQSAWYLSRMIDPPHEMKEEDRFTLRQFLARLPQSNFAKFVFFVACLNASAHFAGCLFIPYWKNTLQYSYWDLMGVACAVVGIQIFALPFWGRQADRYGNKKVLVLCSLGIAVLPALWLGSTHIAWAVMMQAWSGFFWSGFNQSVANFLLDAVTPPKRARCAAYLHLITSCGLLVGGLAGSWASTHMPTSIGPLHWEHRFWTILAISFALRSLTLAFFLPRFREVRDVPQVGVGRMIAQAAREVTGSTFDLLSAMTERGNEEKDEPDEKR